MTDDPSLVSKPLHDGVVPTLPDDDDYDLLTFSEVAVRIAEALCAEEDRLKALENDGKEGSNEEEIGRTLARIDSLRERANSLNYREQTRLRLRERFTLRSEG